MKKTKIFFCAVVAALSTVSGILTFQDSRAASELEISDVENVAEAETFIWDYLKHRGICNFASYIYWCKRDDQPRVEGYYCGSGPGLCIFDDLCHVPNQAIMMN